MNPKEFYAEMIRKYDDMGRREWQRLKTGKPFDFNKDTFHLLADITDDNYVTYCGIDYPKSEENIKVIEGNPSEEDVNYIVEEAHENLKMKCFGCLKNLWKELESYYESIDPRFFEDPKKYPITFNRENKKVIERCIEMYGISKVEDLINELVNIYYVKELVNLKGEKPEWLED